MCKIFRYVIEFYNTYKDEETTEKGILAASDYDEAVALLTSSEFGYGKDLISIKLLDLYDTVVPDDDLAIDLKKE